MSSIDNSYEKNLQVVYADRSNKVSSIIINTSGRTTEVALSLIWINGQPATELKGLGKKINARDLIEIKPFNDEVHLTMQSFKEVALTIVYNGNHPYQVSSGLTTTGLKMMMRREFKLDLFQIYKKNGTVLSEFATLSDLDITEHAELEIKCKIDVEKKIEEENKDKGSLEGPLRFRCVNFKHPIEAKISNEGDEWRKITNGLNLKGKCPNKDCGSQGDDIYIRLGMGTFQLGEQFNLKRCPVCPTRPVILKNCVFWDCYYSISGVLNDEKSDDIKNRLAPEDHAITYLEGILGQPEAYISDATCVTITTSLVFNENSVIKKPSTYCVIL